MVRREIHAIASDPLVATLPNGRRRVGPATSRPSLYLLQTRRQGPPALNFRVFAGASIARVDRHDTNRARESHTAHAIPGGRSPLRVHRREQRRARRRCGGCGRSSHPREGGSASRRRSPYAPRSRRSSSASACRSGGGDSIDDVADAPDPGRRQAAVTATAGSAAPDWGYRGSPSTPRTPPAPVEEPDRDESDTDRRDPRQPPPAGDPPPDRPPIEPPAPPRRRD